jgi:predicted patatin/cPLA2 family phospholipase
VNLSQNFSYAELAHSMDAAFVTVLSEHLECIAMHPERFPHSESISHSQAAWLMAHEGFLELEQKFMERLYEWHSKWQQRFELEGTVKVVAKGAEELKKIKNSKDRERLAKNLYLNNVHLMIGDAQKHIVTLNSRIDFLQENIRKTWHKNCLSDSYSKILPSIEGSLQNHEEKYFRDVINSFFETEQKDSAPSIARRKFLETIMANDDCNLILNLYFSKIFHYVAKISFCICKFYSKKWALYARGFNSRQNLLPLR